MQGEQTKYDTKVANIVIDLKVKTSEFMANKNVEIKATCINDGETVEKTVPMNIVSKSGLVTKSTIKAGDVAVEKVNQNTVNMDVKENSEVEINAEMINNYNDTLSETTIIGTIPEGAVLQTAITTNIEDAEVYYADDVNTDVDSANWKTQDQTFDNVKAFKIVANDIEQGLVMTVNYKYKVLTANSEESTIKVNGTVGEEAKEDTLTFITNATTEQKTEPEQSAQNVDITIEPKTMSKTIYVGQILTYTIKVTNKGTEALQNVSLEYVVPDNTVLTELTDSQGDYMEFTKYEERVKKWSIDKLDVNETLYKEVTIEVQNGAETITNKATLKDAEEEIASVTTEPTDVISGDLTVRLSRRDNISFELINGSEIRYIVIVTNNTQEQMNNLKVTSKVPEGTEWAEDYEINKEWTYNEYTKELEYTIDTLGANETENIEFVVTVGNVNSKDGKVRIDNTAVVVTNEEKEYESNVFTSNVLSAKIDINMTAEHNDELNVWDKVKYIIKVTNIGERDTVVNVEDALPDEIRVDKVTYYVDEDNKTEDTAPEQDVEILLYRVDVGEELTIEIEGTVLDIDDNLKTKQITNIAKIDLGNGEYLESNSITNTIINDNISNINPDEDPNNPGTEPGGDSGDDNGDGNKEGTNSISGLVWIDSNKDGIRDENEQILQAARVILLDKEGNKKDETQTSLTGTYKFTSVEQGEYTVVFVYDESKYAVTKYQVAGATNETNSDVISKQIEINDEIMTAGITDIIKLEGNNITNIDMGLIENAKFDLKLDKYISKVVLTNSSGTSTYEYENTNLAKVEISARKIQGTVLVVEYELKVTNEGDVGAYVKDIVDYMPEGLIFTSETNKDWYMDNNKTLHSKALADQIIKPGDTKTLTLVLTKTLASNSTGTIENIGEIQESSNLQGLTETDSVAGNKKTGEDDISSASLIVSIATGTPLMYIGLVIGITLLFSISIYIIDKKVLKEKIY